MAHNLPGIKNTADSREEDFVQLSCELRPKPGTCHIPAMKPR